MGAGGKEKDLMELAKENNRKQFFSAYKSIKNIVVNYIYKENNKSIDVYLLNPKTLDDFLKTLGDIFNFFENEKELKEKETALEKTFENYSIKDREIEIYNNYEQCQKVMKNTDKDKNEFIIVDSNFTIQLEMKNTEYKTVKMTKIEDQDKDKCIEIKFPSSGKIINALEKKNKKGFFEFYEKKEANKLIIDKKIITKSKIIKNIDSDSMIKNICYCLIKINSLNYYFLCHGDMIKEDKTISSMFFDLINQYNIGNKIDNLKLSDFIKQKKINDFKSIIQFLFNEMHNELKILYIYPDSIINDIFNYQYTFFIKCTQCNLNFQKSIADNIINFSLKDICSTLNSKNLSIYECFNYLSCHGNLNNKNKNCTNCGNELKVLQKLNSVNEILTIIFDLEKDDKDKISLSLDFNTNIKLDKYFENSSQNEYELELIVFSSYNYEDGKFISFSKDFADKKWYQFDGSKEEKIQTNKINYKTPVLLIYKKIYLI